MQYLKIRASLFVLGVEVWCVISASFLVQVSSVRFTVKALKSLLLSNLHSERKFLWLVDRGSQYPN